MAGSWSSTSSRVRAMAVRPLRRARVAGGHAVEPAAAPRAAGGRAVLRARAALAQQVARLVQQLRGHRAVADAGVVRLVHAQDAIDLSWARCRCRSPPRRQRRRHRGRDVLVRAGVEVQQRALRALQEDRLAAGHRLLHERRRVGHVGRQARAVVARTPRARSPGRAARRRTASRGRRSCTARGTESSCSSDSRSSRSATRTPARPTLSTKAGPTPRPVVPMAPSPRSFSSSRSISAVPGHQHLRAVAEEEPALDGDAARLQVLDLLEQVGGVDDDAVADDADLVGVEDAGGHEVELELAELVDDGVAGVVAGGVPGHDVGLLRQQVDDAPLALVPPLAAHDHDDWHKTARLRRTSPLLSVRREYRGRGRWGQGAGGAGRRPASHLCELARGCTCTAKS